MKKRLIFAALLSFGLTSAAQGALDGTQYAVITPTFYTSAGTGTQSYIRLFSGAGSLGATSAFTLTLVGTQTGNVYGQPFTIRIPYMASVQYSVGQLVGLAGAGAFAGGDASFAVFIRNTDPEAGYQHVTYNPASSLFENISNCVSPLNERMIPLHNAAIATNVHTSKVAGGQYPSTLYIYNYSNAPASYTLDVFHGGNAATGTAVAPNSGKLTCRYHPNGPVAANSMLAVPMSAIEATPGCAVDSDEFYATVQVSNDAGPTNATVTHLMRASAYSGDINLTNVCAVNKAPLATLSFPFILAGSSNATYALTAPTGLQAITITGVAMAPSGNVIATGTFQTAPTASVLATAGGFNFTTPDGKTVNFLTSTGSQSFNGPGHYEAKSTDGTRTVEMYMNNEKASTLNFATYGYFVESDGSGDQPLALGTIVAGAATANVPAAGTLTYSGNYTGIVATETNTARITGGNVTLTLNYAAKTVTGTITGITASGVESTTFGPMNDLTLTGTITGNTITGTATPGTAPAGAVVSLGSVTSTFTGTINGPSALDVVVNMPFSGAGVTAVTALGAHSGG